MLFSLPPLPSPTLGRFQDECYKQVAQRLPKNWGGRKRDDPIVAPAPQGMLTTATGDDGNDDDGHGHGHAQGGA